MPKEETLDGTNYFTPTNVRDDQAQWRPSTASLLLSTIIDTTSCDSQFSEICRLVPP